MSAATARVPQILLFYFYYCTTISALLWLDFDCGAFGYLLLIAVHYSMIGNLDARAAT